MWFDGTSIDKACEGKELGVPSEFYATLEQSLDLGRTATTAKTLLKKEIGVQTCFGLLRSGVNVRAPAISSQRETSRTIATQFCSWWLWFLFRNGSCLSQIKHPFPACLLGLEVLTSINSRTRTILKTTTTL